MLALVSLAFVLTKATYLSCDSLCQTSTDCVLKFGQYLCTENLNLNLTTLTLQNSQLLCFDPLDSKGACQLVITADSVMLSNNSTIVASTVSIYTRSITIDNSSAISANGTGQVLKSSLTINGGFAGNFCSMINKNRYVPTSVWGSLSMGLGGNCFNNRGGGVVHIQTNVLIFSGQISAAGNLASVLSEFNEPSNKCTNGGSGGSVYLNYTSLLLGTKSLITVAGGPFISTSGSGGGGGGGGGRVAIYGGISYSGRVIVSGGNSTSKSSKCPNGGSGTLYINATKTLIVNNEGLTTLNPTIISSNSTVSLRVLNQAVAIPDNPQGELSFNSIFMNEGQMNPSSRLIDTTNALILNTGNIQLLESSLIGGQELEQFTLNVLQDMEMDASSVIYFLIKMEITAQNCFINGDLRGFVSLLQPSYLLMLVSKTVTIRSESSIKADRIVVLADSISISGNLHSPDTTCTRASQDYVSSKPPYNCMNDNLIFAPLQPPIEMVNTYNYTVYIYGNTLVDVQTTGRIAGARIGMCSQQVSVNGVISAMGAGCPSNAGPGHGDSVDNVCSGTGGGFGGYGGRGRLYDSDKCKVGQTYSIPSAPWYEGSGGGSPTSSGGDGGGYIQIESIQLNLEGIVSADGQDAILNAAGGGSGGGVFLKLEYLLGSGQIRVNGNPGNLSGGGGGGGRVLISWLGNSITSNTTINYSNMLNNTEDWYGQITSQGGAGSNGGENGSSGTVDSLTCMPGHYGYLCEPCPKGAYSDDLSSAACKQCKHIDSEASFTEEASTSFECSFDCPKGYTKDSSERECLSPVNEFIRLFGGQNYMIVYMILASCSTALAVLFFYYLHRRKRRSMTGTKFRSTHQRSAISGNTRKVPM